MNSDSGFYWCFWDTFLVLLMLFWGLSVVFVLSCLFYGCRGSSESVIMGASVGSSGELVIEFFFHDCGWCRCFHLVLLFRSFIDAVLTLRYGWL